MKKGVLLLLFFAFFFGCKKKTDFVPAIPAPTKMKKLIITGNHPQEYYFTYNGNNVLTKIVSKGLGDASLSEQVESNLVFSANGNLTSVSSIYSSPEDGTIEYAMQYEYDSQNRIALKRISSYGGPFYEAIRYYYSSGDEWKAEVKLNYDELSQTYEAYDSTIFYSYNGLGKPDSSNKYYSSMSNIQSRSKYSYDGLGNLLTLDYNGGDGWFNTAIEYDYNNQVTYPIEFKYLTLTIIDAGELLDPRNDISNLIPIKEQQEVACNSATYFIKASATLEKNANGTISKIIKKDESLDYQDCSVETNNYEFQFYYE